MIVPFGDGDSEVGDQLMDTAPPLSMTGPLSMVTPRSLRACSNSATVTVYSFGRGERGGRSI